MLKVSLRLNREQVNQGGIVKRLVFLLVVLVSALTACFSTRDAHGLANYSWTQTAPTVLRTMPAISGLTNGCTGFLQDLLIAELQSLQRVCRFGNEHLAIGYFSVSGQTRGFIKLAYSNDAHVLEGVCNWAVCRYSADTDILVTQQAVGQYAVGLVVYKQASQRIHRIQTGDSTRYIFDTTNPEYSIKDDAGHYVWTPSFALSQNGQWIVVELRDSGLARINTESLSVRHIAMSGYRYGYGMDPIEQLAISNDGQSVALMGINVGFSIIDVTANCGQGLISDLRPLPTTTQCPSSDIGIGRLFAHFSSAEQPRFIGDGGQLEVIINSWAQPGQRATFLASGALAAHQLKLLSMGDSFTSGEGETDPFYYQTGTNDVFDTCHLSRRSYPFLLAGALGLGADDARSVACSGARTSDIVGNSDLYWGQGGRLGDDGLGLTNTIKRAAQELAVTTFQPGRSLQSSFLERYDPESITISIGGNDAGLMGKVKTCAMPGTCEWVRAEGLRSTANEIKALHTTLTTLFSQISKSNPSAKVYVVGYPNVINPDGQCGLLTSFLLDHSERVYIQKSLEYLNQVIHAATYKAGFTFLDVGQSLSEKQLCGSSGSTAMNGLRNGDDFAVTNAFPMLKIIGVETFHPTPQGHGLMTDAMLVSHPGLQYDADCLVDHVECAVPELSIEPPAYWNVSAGIFEKMSFSVDFTQSAAPDSRELRIKLPEGTFEDKSEVKAEIHSESMVLSIFKTTEGGGVSQVVTLPMSIADGFHSLHLYGSNREGRPIDLYQFITIGKDSEVVGSGIDTHQVVNNSNLGVKTMLADTSTRLALPIKRTAMSMVAAINDSSVLGAENSTAHSASSGASTTTAVHEMVKDVMKRISPKREWTAMVIGGIASVIVLLITIWLRIRWVKQQS